MSSHRYTNVVLTVIALCLICQLVFGLFWSGWKAQEVRLVGAVTLSDDTVVGVCNPGTRPSEFSWFNQALKVEVE